MYFCIMKLNLVQRISTLVELGKIIITASPERAEIIQKAKAYNPWFTEESIKNSFNAISNNFLQRDILTEWINNYHVGDKSSPRVVGMVLAGNIPMVGFHDMMCTFVSGHHSMIKMSEKDTVLMKYLLDTMYVINPETKAYFSTTDKLMGYDAVIATGSNNTASYFHKYFANHPHIIRRNRNGIALLDGNESREELHNLGIDIFTYFGLGCRNVSKIYLPDDYDFEPLLEELHKYNQIVLHNKYMNNYDYNIALYLLNKADFINNGSIILMKDERIPSRIATCHYELYTDLNQVSSALLAKQDDIQCVVTNIKTLPIKTYGFGKAQSPAIDDYADGVDTMAFLKEIY